MYNFLEEILSTPSAIWMSSDGYLMLYGSFNDSMVEEQKFSWYGTTNSVTGRAFMYPEIRTLRYFFFCINKIHNNIKPHQTIKSLLSCIQNT